MTRVLGADGCKGGWVGVVLDDDRGPWATIARDMPTLIGLAGPVDVIGIDMPIHLSDDTDRECDTAARRALSPHGSRVFNAPISAVLASATYEDAKQTSALVLGKKISLQTWGLVPKIAEVDHWLPDAPYPVYEVHPELSFAAMCGRVIAASKKTREGAAQRRDALVAQGLSIPADIRQTADLLDACAVAWSARRLAMGEGGSLPDPAPVVKGQRQAIWY